MTRATTAMITDRVCWEPLRRSTGMGDQYRPGCAPSGTRLGGRYGLVDPGHLRPERTTMTAALSDLRVVEMGQLLAGPFCGQLLADFGADVIKLEPPGQGDPMREWGREKADGRSLWWPVVARGKRSVTINLREKDGQDLARRLIATA